MSAGYTYTTITSGTDQPVQIEVSFRLDSTSWIRAYGRDSGQPQLSIRHGSVCADVAPTPGRITEADARAARELADQAVIYATDVERLYAEQQARAENEAAA